MAVITSARNHMIGILTETISNPTLHPAAALKGLQAVAWFEGKAPLRSGWAWGQGYLEGGVAVLASPYGQGKLCLFGPEVTFRGQPHGSFKFLFNGIYLGTTVETTLSE